MGCWLARRGRERCGGGPAERHSRTGLGWKGCAALRCRRCLQFRIILAEERSQGGTWQRLRALT